MSGRKKTVPATVDTTSRELWYEAYSQLKEAIYSHELQAGVRITETELSERLSMSRTPIREAIYRLEAEGLLSHEPRRGLVITQPDHQMVMELYTMRETLEGAAARLAAQHASEAELMTLREINESEKALFGNPKGLSELNRKFHMLISLSAHNRYLLKSLENMAATIALLPTLLNSQGRPQEAHDEHRAILDALIARDAAAAEEAARAHIRSARLRRVEIFTRSLHF